VRSAVACDQPHDFFGGPDVVGHTSFHCWRYAEPLMNTAKLVHEVERHGRRVVLNLLAEGCPSLGCQHHSARSAMMGSTRAVRRTEVAAFGASLETGISLVSPA